VLQGGHAATTWTSPTNFGYLYVDFGAPGVLLGYGLIGVLTGILQTRLFRMNKTLLRIGALAYVSELFMSQMCLGMSVGFAVDLILIFGFHSAMRRLVGYLTSIGL
jgi:hypothetical protein